MLIIKKIKMFQKVWPNFISIPAGTAHLDALLYSPSIREIVFPSRPENNLYVKICEYFPPEIPNSWPTKPPSQRPAHLRWPHQRPEATAGHRLQQQQTRASPANNDELLLARVCGLSLCEEKTWIPSLSPEAVLEVACRQIRGTSQTTTRDDPSWKDCINNPAERRGWGLEPRDRFHSFTIPGPIIHLCIHIRTREICWIWPKIQGLLAGPGTLHQSWNDAVWPDLILLCPGRFVWFANLVGAGWLVSYLLVISGVIEFGPREATVEIAERK